MASAPPYDIVVPTLGRPSLAVLLHALDAGTGPAPGRVLLIDDRSDRTTPLPAGDLTGNLAGRVEVLPGRAAGPAAARNVGWRAATADWVAFVDDDVVPEPDWAARLTDDLAACPADVAGTQGRLHVPLPTDRLPTDWERNVAGLATAQWATADLAYRRTVLEEVGGFDERFPRAYREDADLGLRVTAAGHRIVAGRRRIEHPVRPAPWHVSIGKQAGNADDALMDRLHGPGWRMRAGAPPGTRRRHLVVTGAGLVALLGVATRRRAVTRAASATWLAGTAQFAYRRIAPGPKTVQEVASMVATSALLPAAASVAFLRGVVRARRLAGSGDPTLAGTAGPEPAVDAVLFDRDGTLIVDVPYNGDPQLVRPVAGARDVLDRLRGAGIRIAMVSNQSGIARGLITRAQVDDVNRRVEELLGPFDAVLVCPHGPEDGCDCRKPLPGMVTKAAAELGVDVGRCVMVGDIGSDVDAARAAGARALLVPTSVTLPDEVAAAPEVVADLRAAVDLVLGGAES